jgi:hypothetical protein
LERAKRQIVEWFELTSRGIESPEDIMRVEPTLKRHVEIRESEVCRKIENRLLELSLRGLREEVARIQQEARSY